MKSRRPPTRRSTGDPAPAEQVAQLYRDIYQVVRRIPPGKVATYGQVAELAGRPGASRAAGAAMRLSTPDMGLPWQRVVGKHARGLARVSIHDPVGGAMQRALLEAEGVCFTAAGRISLAEHGWLPSPPKPRTARRHRRAAR